MATAKKTKAEAKPKAKKEKKTKAVAQAKASSKADDFRSQTGDELNDRLVKLQKEQFNLRFQRANGQLENTGRVRSLRKDIARIQTVLTEQRRKAAAKG